MYLNIRAKVFLIMLLTSVTIISAMFFFMLSSFEMGFSGYVDKIGVKQLENLSRHLGELYLKKGSFNFLNQDSDIVETLENILFPEFAPMEEPEQAENLQPFDLEIEMDFQYDPVFFVLDPDKQPLFGFNDNQADLPLLPVKANGEIVGWVGVQAPVEKEDLLFIEDQSRSFMIIAAVMLTLSVGAAMAWAWHLEGPVKVLAGGTRSLASGNYNIRIPVQSKDELGQLTRDFNTLAHTLEENVRARQKWVEDISHELKTPLTLLGGELEAIKDGIRPLSPETINLLMGDIAHLTGLVNNLNDLWQSETGALTFKKKEVDLVPLLERARDKFKEKYAEANLKLQYNTTGTGKLQVHGDREKLSQVFDNLLQNSLRYTDAEGEVRVLLEPRGTTARIHVQDSAPGVPPGDYEKLFERLYRVEPSRNRAFGGAGIGLAICRNIITAHNGTIAAKASPLGGVWMQIEIPIQTKA